MAKSEVWFETPPFRDDYQLVDGGERATSRRQVRPKQFLHINQAECILCEGCVDICPWKCIHYLSLDAIDEAYGVDHPSRIALDNLGFFVVDEYECTRCAALHRPLPHQRDLHRQVRGIGHRHGNERRSDRSARPWDLDTGARDFKNGYTYGMRW